MYLGDFLFRNGSKFQHNFKFASELKCGQPAPKIEVLFLIGSKLFIYLCYIVIGSRDRF